MPRFNIEKKPSTVLGCYAAVPRSAWIKGRFDGRTDDE